MLLIIHLHAFHLPENAAGHENRATNKVKLIDSEVFNLRNGTKPENFKVNFEMNKNLIVIKVMI
jgi:hypothetical protein